MLPEREGRKGHTIQNYMELFLHFTRPLLDFPTIHHTYTHTHTEQTVMGIQPRNHRSPGGTPGPSSYPHSFCTSSRLKAFTVGALVSRDQDSCSRGSGHLIRAPWHFCNVHDSKSDPFFPRKASPFPQIISRDCWRLCRDVPQKLWA